MIVTLISNVSSLDPLSASKGTYKIFGEQFYVKDFWNDGPDGIEYNMQYLKPVKHQNDLVKQAVKDKADIFVGNCNELKLGERIWSMSIHNNFYPIKFDRKLECINFFEIEDEKNLQKITGKRIMVDKEYKSQVESLLNKSKE